MNAPLATPARLGARLSVMFALETASIAAYAPLLSLHARDGLGFSPLEMSIVFAVGPLTALIGPPFAGFLADRVLRAELALALASLCRAFALCFAARAGSFESLVFAMALHGIFIANSGVLLNTIAFHHLPDARRYGTARVWGTASWSVMVWATMAFLGAEATRAGELRALHLCFYAGAAAAFAQAVYALTLPATAPAPSTRGMLEALEALALLRSPRFAAALGVALLTGILMQANLILQGLFCADPAGLALSPADAGRATTVSQVLEVLLFPFLAALLHRFGIRTIVLVGMLAWPLRYAAYLALEPSWLVISAQALHGINYVFGYTGLQIAIELMAPPGFRGRAQAAFLTSSSGVGNLVGQLGCGLVLGAATHGGVVAWRSVFLAPFLVAVVALAIAYWGVREPESVARTEPRPL